MCHDHLTANVIYKTRYRIKYRRITTIYAPRTALGS